MTTQLYAYPGTQAQDCQFCGEFLIPKTFYQGEPVCAQCIAQKGFAIVSSTQLQPTPLLSPEDEKAILDLLSGGPATTAEVSRHLKTYRDKSLKQMCFLLQEGKVSRFGGRPGGSSWWALPGDDSKVPKLEGKCFSEQILEILGIYQCLSIEQMRLKLGKNPGNIKSVASRLEEVGKVRSYHTGPMQYFEVTKNANA
ncbi:hypothetical protein [Iningainema tapete]|uniref:Uncharacterized protein n=1 Tax=Iningainema tapete BLCC-T55 TaxID=2748662 RepID=A0A8J7BWM4_9CYAN|nr:hypothetical protein [Iningainema tapete]MBD2771198.1 hypothetical protein [Iningainema tapete BLCC-T55]